MISCRYLDKSEISIRLPQLFSILHENMSGIAPTGNSYDEDYGLWKEAVAPALQKENRHIVLIFNDEVLIGYLQYYTNVTTFMIEEAQLQRAYQGRGVMRQTFSFISGRISQDVPFVEAFANKENTKSQSILGHLGFTRIGENKKGSCYHYRGDCQSFLKRLMEKTAENQIKQTDSGRSGMTRSDLTLPVDDGYLNIRVGAIIRKDEKFLMVENPAVDYYYSVGGRIQFGETAEQAVIREVEEETGVKMEIDRLGFIHENFFYHDFAQKKGKLIYEISFYFYMKTPADFIPDCVSLSSEGNAEKLVWVSSGEKKKYYPEFFRTELKHPSSGVKHIVTDER